MRSSPALPRGSPAPRRRGTGRPGGAQQGEVRFVDRAAADINVACTGVDGERHGVALLESSGPQPPHESSKGGDAVRAWRTSHLDPKRRHCVAAHRQAIDPCSRQEKHGLAQDLPGESGCAGERVVAGGCNAPRLLRPPRVVLQVQPFARRGDWRAVAQAYGHVADALEDRGGAQPQVVGVENRRLAQIATGGVSG